MTAAEEFNGAELSLLESLLHMDNRVAYNMYCDWLVDTLRPILLRAKSLVHVEMSHHDEYGSVGASSSEADECILVAARACHELRSKIESMARIAELEVKV